MFCCSPAYLGSEIEVLSGMFTWISSFSSGPLFRLARLRVSVRTCFLSGRYSTLRSHPLTLRIMTCNLNGAAVIGLWSIVSKGLWSVCITMVFPRMYSLNCCVLEICFLVFSIVPSFATILGRSAAGCLQRPCTTGIAVGQSLWDSFPKKLHPDALCRSGYWSSSSFMSASAFILCTF